MPIFPIRAALAAAFLAIVPLACLAAEDAVPNPPGDILAGIADRPFETLGVRQGLPDDGLYSVVQDSVGFLWIGTRQGLARYDGYRVRTYRHDPADPTSLPDESVRALLPAQDGALWVGTNKFGMLRYDPVADDFERLPNEPRELADTLVFTLAPDGHGGVWEAHKSGLAHFSPAGQGSWEVLRKGDASHFPFAQAFSALIDRNGNLWVGGDNGVAVRRAGSDQFAPVPAEPEAQKLGHQHIWALFEDNRGRIWIGSDGDGVGFIDPASGRIHAAEGLSGAKSPIGSATVRGFIEPTPDEIWIATFGSGLITADQNSGAQRQWTNDVSLQAPISNDYLRALWQTRSGRVFIATDRGLASTDPSSSGILSLHPSPYRKSGLTGKSVFSVMATADDNVWVGYGDGMIEAIDPAGQVRPILPDRGLGFDKMPKRQIQSFEKAPDGSIIAAADGLYRIDPHHFSMRPLGDKPILRDSWIPTLLARRDALWVGTYDGLAKIDPVNGELLAQYHHTADPSSLPDELVSKILPAADGHIWVSTRNGLCHFDPETQACRNFRNDPNDAASLPVNNINGMVMDDQGRLWLATQGGGLVVMEAPADEQAAPHFRQIGPEQGLPAAFVGVLVKGTDGRIWMNPPAGICVIDPATLQITRFTAQEGAWLGSSFLKGSTVLSDGTILFPAEDGINVVRPDHLQPPPRPARLVLSEVTVGRGKPLPVGPLAKGAPIVLPAGESGFVAEFALLDLSAPGSTRYAYRLEGMDEEWLDSMADRRTAAYTRLPPGDYSLLVRSMADGGRGATSTISVPVKVIAAWYQATWFHLLLGLFGITALLAAERARTAFLRHRHRLLEALVEERTASLHKTQGELQILLDNAEQGFLAIGPDLLVRGQFSAACRSILGADPQSGPLPDLLHPGDERLAASQRSILNSVFKGGDDFTRGLKLELMEKEARIGERIVQVMHKWLPQRQLVMVMLSDVTETRKLTAAVERERVRIEMIVLAITESREFVELSDEYRRFLQDELPALLAAPETRTDLLRRLHTYKGLLAQFNFFHSPEALHQTEQAVIAAGRADSGALAAALEMDLASVTDSLGPDFLAGGGAIALRPEQLDEMKRLAAEALSAAPTSASLRRLAGILDDFAALDVKAALALHSRGAQALAERLEKALAPVKITGDAVRLPEERYSAFFRSLVHVFRNAVDHGIETPDERVDADKPEEGEIICRVERDGEDLLVIIADDGRGIDRERLEEKWVEAGHDPDEAARLPLEELVFADGISSREESTGISGRGVGMAAVKAELIEIGGSVTLATETGQGTRVTFRLPVVRVDSPWIKTVSS